MRFISKNLIVLLTLFASANFSQMLGQCNAITIECGGYQGGPSYFYSTNGEANDFDINDYDCISSQYNFDGPDIVFEYIKYDYETTYITLFNYNTDLDLFILEDCEGATTRNLSSCIASSINDYGEIYGGINFDYVLLQNPGTYYIVIDGYNSSQVDDFFLNISCDEFWDCSTEREIYCDDIINDSTCPPVLFLTSTSKNSYYSCFDLPAWTGHENVYRFEATQAGLYQFDAYNLTDDIDMFILYSSSCDWLSGNDCIDYSLESGTNPESREITLSQGQVVYIVLDGWFDACSDYTLSVSCVKLNCHNAYPIYCGEYIDDDNFNGTNSVDTYRDPYLDIDYYNLTGNEKIYEFIPYQNGYHSFYLSHLSNTSVDLDIFILDDCHETSVIATTDGANNSDEDEISTFLYAGTTYYIVVDGDGSTNSIVASDYSLNVNCPSYCDTKPIVCEITEYGDNYSYNISNPKPRDFCFYNQSGTHYSKLSGGEAIYLFTPEKTQEYEIELTDVLQGNDLDVFVVENCNPLACIAASDSNSSTDPDVIKVTLIEGTDYQIIVDGDGGSESTFSLKVKGCKDFLDKICESMSPILLEDFESYNVNVPIENQSTQWLSSGVNSALVVDNSTLLKTKSLSVGNNSGTIVSTGNNLSYKAYKIDHDLEIFYLPNSITTNILPNMEIYMQDASLLDLVKSISIKVEGNNKTTLNYITSGLFGSNSVEIANLGDIFYTGVKTNSKKFRLSWIIDVEGGVALYVDGHKVANYTIPGGIFSLSYGLSCGTSQGHFEIDNLCIGGCHKDATHACHAKQELHCDKFENYVVGVEIQNYSGWTTGGLSNGCKIVTSPQGSKALGIIYDGSDCGAEYTIVDATGPNDVVELNYDIYISTGGGLQSIIYNDDPNGFMFFNFVQDELNYQIGDYAYSDYQKVDIPLDKFFKFRLQLNKQNGTVRVYFDDQLFTEVVNTNIKKLSKVFFDSNLSGTNKVTYIDNLCFDKCKECKSYNGPFDIVDICNRVKIKKIVNQSDELANYTFFTDELPSSGTWSLQEEDENGQTTTLIEDQASIELIHGCRKGKKYVICFKYYDEDGCEQRCCIKLDLTNYCGGDGITPYFIGNETNNQFTFEIEGLTSDEEVSNWFIDELAVGSNTSINYTFPAPGQRYICCLIYNRLTGCYRVCCRRYCIENPLNCNKISTTIENNGMSYLLQISDAQEIIQWNIDVPSVSNSYIGNSNPQTFNPANHGIAVGQSIIVSAKYIDYEGCVKVCCKRITYNPGNNGTGVIFTLEETCIAPGQGAEIPVSVKNFDKVGAFNYTLKLPANSNISFQNIVNATLQNVTFNIVSDQEIIIAWDEPNGNSIDLQDNTRIFNISISANPGFLMPTYITGNSIAVLSDVHSNGIIEGGNICFSNGQIVKGNIKNEIGKAHSNLSVELLQNGQFASSTTTDNAGSYSFNMAMSQDIVKPSKNDEIKKGVNVVDVARIRRHFLQKTFLDTDYKMVAADANKDGKINIVDVALVNRVFLQKITAFPNNTSWRFLPENLDISGDPLNVNWPEEVNLSMSGLDYDAVDFVSIKVGDVDNSALFKEGGNVNKNRIADIEISIPDTSVAVWEPVLLPINVENFDNVSVLTYEVNYDTNKLEFITIEQSNLDGFNEGNYNDLGGKIIIGWDHPQASGQTIKGSLMQCKFKAKHADVTDTEISFSSLQALDEGFNELGINGKTAFIGFIHTATKEEGYLYNTNIYPNPFSDAVNVTIDLPSPENIELLFHDVSGKLIKKFASGIKNYNYQFSVSGIDYQGVLLCTVKGESFTHTYKIIKI